MPLVLNTVQFKSMNSMEIIEIRIQFKTKQKLEEELKKILSETEYGNRLGQQIKIYKRLNLGTDYVILLMNHSKQRSLKDSQFGIQLSTLLKDYGMVNYSKWKEI